LIEHLKAKGGGSVFKSIITSDIENSILCIASPDVIDNFTKAVHHIFLRIKFNTEEIAELTKQRDELLPLLMNGQVTVTPPAVNCDLSAFILYMIKYELLLYEKFLLGTLIIFPQLAGQIRRVLEDTIFRHSSY
jgi:hypothetical protein